MMYYDTFERLGDPFDGLESFRNNKLKSRAKQTLLDLSTKFTPYVRDCSVNFKTRHQTWKDGEKDGVWKRWYENGQQWYEEVWKDGKEDGVWKWWYINGQQKYEGVWKDGKRNGVWKMWHKSGQQWYERVWKDGV